MNALPLFMEAAATGPLGMPPWLWQALGWLGSILVVVSLMQSRVMWLRFLNMSGSVIGTVWNAVEGIWPFMAMNAAIVLINVYWLIRMQREATDGKTYQVVDVSPDDAFLDYFATANAADIMDKAPRFTQARKDKELRHAFFVMNGAEVVGVVAVGHDPSDAPATANLLLDWVSTKYRDYTPGQYVYDNSHAFAQLGFDHVIVREPLPASATYLEAMGFVHNGDVYERDVR
ncbi:MAG: hypothetical protein LBH13_00055 [Cellulomonadaceae bacterium]|jgi:hypothetical protein|nr:hypothetical protein [Cellulomonadaceae bacterium]